MNDSSVAAAEGRVVRHPSLWVRELPFTLVLLLIMLGVAYTSLTKQPIIAYWEILVPIIAGMCIGTGWHGAADLAGRWRLIWTQILHWLAFLIVMNLAFLPAVQRVFAAGAAGLAIFTLLTLGTFTAGVHILSWQICLLGLVMAVGVPTIALIENSALIAVLAAAAALAMVAVFGWRLRNRHVPSTRQPDE